MTEQPHDLLRRIGEAIPGGQVEISRQLNTTDRSVRAWVSGDRPVPWWAWLKIITLLRQNIGKQEKLLAKVLDITDTAS